MQDETHVEDWGELFVTRKCCGAGTCRNYAPELLGEVAPASDLREGRRLSVLPGSYEDGAFTGVLRQPRSKEDLMAARTAAAACPFGAIKLKPGAARARRGDLGSPWRGFPRPIEDHVWVIGQPSIKNFGAVSYFIERDGGGVLIDPPKPSEEVFRWLAEHGGVRWLFLTHRDHTNHHAEFASRFPGCRRIIGAADVNLRETKYMPSTGDVEIKLGNELGPLSIEGQSLSREAAREAEIMILPQPGHTPGSLCLLYRGRFLFTGDHLSYSRFLGQLVAHRLQCWEDWERQVRSVRYLLAAAEAGWLRFAWVLPGHGEWARLPGEGRAAETATELRRVITSMEQKPKGYTPLSRWILYVQSRMAPEKTLGRALRAIGGGSDAWVLPRGARSSLTDFDPDKTQVALRRLYLLGAAALLAAAGTAWLTARRDMSALSGRS
ncbi:MBL fold metallo-hydrolase [Sorangium atrum]|uniref:MBL fold metallo-hydrolase n=1 Tax=Sorangium atrum TaxID=2995308 RepID=A0ABT5BXV3_9BACT|nr:MBL fold metallo-hydrolase [Sorangium aterium]MDC0678958.1 MBL fold metallo-hydrolase [Sorangium aterium]